MSSRCGLAADQVLEVEFEIVTLQDEIVTTNECQNHFFS